MERPSRIPKDVLPYIEDLEAQLSKFTKSPYSESYLTIYNQLKSFNEQLEIGVEITIISEEGVSFKTKKGFIDLFASKEDKSFDRTKWYFDKILDLNKTLDDLRKMMTPEEQEILNKKLKEQNLGTAERIALNYVKK